LIDNHAPIKKRKPWITKAILVSTKTKINYQYLLNHKNISKILNYAQSTKNIERN